jgi:hypothetical protein
MLDFSASINNLWLADATKKKLRNALLPICCCCKLMAEKKDTLN